MTATAARPMFMADAVTRRFGSVVAVGDVSLSVEPGQIHGLIGPNGSGKTTLLNLLSGFYAADRGRIALGDIDLTHVGVTRRAELGIARTFQTPRLLGSLSVLDNVMLGGWHQVRSTFMESALALPRPRREARAIRERATALLDGVGLGRVARQRADTLGHSAQRVLEIARALCMQPRFILLDEPAGGLTVTEIAHLGTIIATMRDAGIGVLLVEHHTDFVFRTCDCVTTLDLGRIIASGAPHAVRTHPDVVKVYLGA